MSLLAFATPALTKDKARDRWYNPSPDVNYVLPSDDVEKKRLTVQHFYAVRKLYNNKLVFVPGVSLRRGDRVLDSATGSGIWLTELAKEAPPGVELVGVDIQDQLFPVSSENVEFHRHSILALPATWSNSFTFVNQRLLVCAFTEPEWKMALGEIRRVLAPGGRAQFTEAHLPTHRAGPAMRQLEEAMQAVYAAKGIYYRVPEALPGMLKDAGYVNVHSRVQMLPIGSWGGRDGTLLANIVIGMFSGHRGPILKLGLMEESEFDQLLEATRREWDELPGMSRVYTTAFASKPLFKM